ncbi:MAG: tetratricopeptide repeat protein [Pirellulales bacterium]
MSHLIVFLLLAFTCQISSLAQDAETTNRLVSEASKLSQSADSVESYTELLEVCRQARALPLAAQYEKYFRELSAWAYNKRGEMLSVEASKLKDDQTRLAAEKKSLLDFENAVRLNPKSWKSVHNRGVSHAVIGDSQKAMADFNTTIQLRPQFANAWFNRAELKYQSGQHVEAIFDYNQAIKLNPKDAAAYNGRGHSRYLAEQYKAALSDYSQAVQLAPTQMEGYANRADALSDLGYWETSIRDYRQALKLNANADRVKQGLAWVLATCPEVRFRNSQQAVQYAQEALADPTGKDYRYYDTLAAAQAAAGKFAEAKKSIIKAVQLAPKADQKLLEHRKVLYEADQPYREPSR